MKPWLGWEYHKHMATLGPQQQLAKFSVWDTSIWEEFGARGLATTCKSCDESYDVCHYSV